MEEQQEQKRSKRKDSTAPSLSKKYKTRYAWLNVLPADLWLKVRVGDNVREALQKEDVEVDGECGGLGKCGKCKITVLSAIGPPTREEEELLDQDELQQGVRLACRTKIHKDLVVHTGGDEPALEYVQIAKTGLRPVFQLAPLVERRLVTVPSELLDEGVSDLDRIKLVMGPEYESLRAPLRCLQSLPQVLEETGYDGVAVLHGDSMMAWQGRAQVDRHYGLVFDIGTSTLVGKLVSLVDGTEVGVASCLNSQYRHGGDVISRLQYARQHLHGLESLHNLLLKDLNRIVQRLLRAAELRPEDVFVAVAAGNTTMQHLLLSLSPVGIAEAPFTPVLTDGLVVKAVDVGLELNPEALLYVMPIKSGYIGGDLISVVLASGAYEQSDEIVMGLDLGTNGEMFLGNRKRLMTCSAAAGPALEGATISRGMIAKAGAIEAVKYEAGGLRYQVIGNVSPRGICGSGLVDLVAVLLELGVIDYEGLIRRPAMRSLGNLATRAVCRSGSCDFLVASPDESYDSRSIYLAQRDVRQLQLAKGAIAAGARTLMDEMGVGIRDIRRLYLAGALGNYVDPASAVAIGLIPPVELETVTSLGNGASTGASMVLLSREYWRMANELSDVIEHVELSSRVDFNDYFIEELDFPRRRKG